MPREQEPEEAPGPDPERTPGLEEGGSVPPGDTPPEAAQASRAVVPEEGEPARRPMKWTWLVVIGVVVLLVASFFVTMAIGLLLG
ncbi:DUF6480 family protein [Salinifilum ghardaiensis]